MPADDAALLDRAREYDAAALGQLYIRYADRIHRYVYSRVGHEEIAQDLTSIAFVRVLEAVRAGRTWRVSFPGWLFRIAHNVVVDHFRRPRAEDCCLPLEDELASPLDMEGGAVDAETVGALRVALCHLTAGQGQVIALCYDEGLGNVEAAEALGKSEGSIKALRRRALIVLREHMEVTAWRQTNTDGCGQRRGCRR